MDLAALWKGRRWVALLDYIDQLPATSRLRAAMLTDPEVAEQILAAEDVTEDEPAKWSPPLTEWDTQTEILSGVYDRLGEVVKVLAALKAGVPVVQQERLKSPPRVPDRPFPRPVSAVQEARERAAKQAAQQLVEWFFPHAN